MFYQKQRLDASYSTLIASPKVVSLIQSAVDQLNAGLASYETIKRFALMPKDLTIEDGELTASMKVRRKVVEEKFKNLLDGFYEGSMAQM